MRGAATSAAMLLTLAGALGTPTLADTIGADESASARDRSNSALARVVRIEAARAAARDADRPTPLGTAYRVIDPHQGCFEVSADESPAAANAVAELAADRVSNAKAFVQVSNRDLHAQNRSGGLTIVYLLNPDVAADQAFVDGLLAASAYWERTLNDPATLTIAVGFTSNQSFLAAAGTGLYTWNYPSVRQATINAAATTVSAYVANLPEVMSYVRTTGAGDTASDNAMTINNAVYQSLGFESLTDVNEQDSSIVFNTDFSFDTDPSDGISPGTFDLVYIMVHELGHALGFSSLVDTSLNNTRFNSLEMYRFEDDDQPETAAEFASFPRELRPGVEAAIPRLGFFGNTLEPLRFSTGRNNGDGRQASHWKDDVILDLPIAIGVMDPTYNGDRIPPGYITSADRLLYSLIGWDIDPVYCRWNDLGSGASATVRALAVHDDGSGPALYAGGTFTQAGGSTAFRIARWNGSAWSALADGIDFGISLDALASFDGQLYAGGEFSTFMSGEDATNIARWDGNAWSPLIAQGLNGAVSAMTVFDDGNGPALYIGGAFSGAIDSTGAISVPASNIIRWDGANWSALGTGTNAPVRALTVFDDGNAPALYAGGEFIQAGGIDAFRVARWNGSTWSEVSSGFGNTVHALAVHDDGNGPALYAGGAFVDPSIIFPPFDFKNHIARWDGATWVRLGEGLNNTVFALASHDHGTGEGPVLYAGGQFTTAGGQPASRIARWDGSGWSPLVDGVNNTVRTLSTFDDGQDPSIGPALYAGGQFTAAGGRLANRIAQWGCTDWTANPDSGTPCPADLTGSAFDGVPDGVVNAFDLSFYIDLWLAGDPGADLTGPPLDGVPDGAVNVFDLNFYVTLWLDGQGPCP